MRTAFDALLRGFAIFLTITCRAQYVRIAALRTLSAFAVSSVYAPALCVWTSFSSPPSLRSSRKFAASVLGMTAWPSMRRRQYAESVMPAAAAAAPSSAWALCVRRTLTTRVSCSGGGGGIIYTRMRAARRHAAASRRAAGVGVQGVSPWQAEPPSVEKRSAEHRGRRLAYRRVAACMPGTRL